jgi:deoxyribose-phosphate aldolase
VTKQEILNRIDHTLLKAAASWEEIKTLCDEAVRFNTASACIPPAFVKAVNHEYGSKLAICTVVGFPLGYNVTAAKIFEAGDALADGASELDMVINLGDVKRGRFDLVYEEIKLLKETAGDKTLKVIVETCYLNEDEKIRLCGIVSQAGADYIKTSTGFGPAGATVDDVKLFRQYTAPKVKIKAAGGVKTLQEIEALIAAGADRIGSSSAVRMLVGE